MLPYRDSRLTYIILAVFFVLLIGYAAFEAQGILFGPRISVSSQVTEIHDPLILIKGRADRIASLSMNGKAISVTETGVFEQPYLLAPGYNRILLEARDKYGHTTRRVLEVVYTPSTDSTSSPQTSSGQAPERAGPSAATTTVETSASSTTPVAPR